jgi:hypothetical protein
MLVTDSEVEPKAGVGECDLLEADSATALKAQPEPGVAG